MYSKQNNVRCVLQGGAWSGDGLPRDSFRPDEDHKIRRSGDQSGKVMVPSSLYSTILSESLSYWSKTGIVTEIC